MSKELLTRVNIIEIQDAPNQKISVTMADKKVDMYLKYNTLFDYWTIDIYSRNKPLISGVKLVLDIDLLQRYNLGLGSLTLLHITAKETVKEPNRYNLVNGDIRMYSFWREYVDVG